MTEISSERTAPPEPTRDRAALEGRVVLPLCLALGCGLGMIPVERPRRAERAIDILLTKEWPRWQ